MKAFIFRHSFYAICFLFGFIKAVNPNVCYAQAYDPPLRIELEVEDNKYPYHLRLLGKNGFILFSKTDIKDAWKWTITHYDTNFKRLLSKDIKLETPLIVSAINADKENFYAILQAASVDKKNLANIYVIQYNITSKKIDVFSFYQSDWTNINNIALLGDVFVYTTYNAKAEDRIYLFNTKTLTTSRLYENKTSPFEFQEFYLDTLTNSLWLITKFFESKRVTVITLTQLDGNGKVIDEKDIIVGENYYLNSCKMMRLNANQCLLIGEYTLNYKENPSITRNNNAGIFSVAITNNEIHQIFYLEYGQLEGPFNTTNRKNNPDLHSNTYIATQTDSIMIVVADFYKPEYVHETHPSSMGYGVWNAPTYLATEAKLAGFRYHLAYFFIYDKSGKMQWYNTFNYNGLMLKNIKELMRVHIEEETYNTLYFFAFDGKLYSLVNNRDKIIQPINIEKIEPSSRFYSVNTNARYHCDHWYDDSFIYYGYQSLYNRYSNSSKSKKNKQVFYVNKLTYK